MKEEQHQIPSLAGHPLAWLTAKQASSPARHQELPSDVKVAAVITGLNGGMDNLMENASGEQTFMDEKQLLAKLPISRRTLGNWKTTGIIPYIKIGRRCLYDWASVHGALLRRQRGGQ